MAGAATLDQVASDEMVANFFSVDFQTLDPDERTLLEEVARDGTRSRRDLAQALSTEVSAKAAYAKGLEVARTTGDLQTGKEIEVFLRRLEKA